MFLSRRAQKVQKRKARKVKQARKEAREDLCRRELLAETLHLAGATQTFESLPKSLQNDLLDYVPCESEVVLADSVAEDRVLQEVRRAHLERIGKPMPGCKRLTQTLAISNLEMLSSAAQFLLAPQPNYLLSKKDHVKQSLAKLELLTLTAKHQRAPYHFDTELFHLWFDLVQVSDPRSIVYWASPTSCQRGYRLTPQIVLFGTAPYSILEEINSHRRRLYRCFVPKLDGPVPLSYSSAELSIDSTTEKFDVYFQDHAVQRLAERLPGVRPSAVIFALAGRQFFWKGNNVFIGYPPGDQRLGYFVGNIIGNKIVIRTFKFLTMNGTPEAKLLWQKLRLEKNLMHKYKFDDLATFTSSDMKNHPELRDILSDCGCGHLLTADEVQQRGVARAFADYLQKESQHGYELIFEQKLTTLTNRIRSATRLR